MKSADALLSAWFAKKKLASTTALVVADCAAEVATLRLALGRADLDRALSATLELLALPPTERSPERCVDTVRLWAGCRSTKTTALVSTILLDRLALLSPEKALDALPDSGLVECWRKAAGLPVPDLTAQVLARSEHTFPLAAFDWALFVGPASPDLAPLRCLLDHLGKPEFGKIAAARLVTFLSKDPKAQHLGALLAILENEPTRIPAVVPLIQNAVAALVAVVDNLPQFAGPKTELLHLARFIEGLFAPILDASGHKRTRGCALLARLGTGILLIEKRGRAGEDALSAVSVLGQQLRTTARGADNMAGTWFLASASQPSLATDEMITAEGASRWAFAYEESQQAGLPLDALESLGRNLGLRPISETGAVFSFEPRWHEDIEGGLLPDTTVRAETGGWQFQGRPIVRARVRSVKQ